MDNENNVENIENAKVSNEVSNENSSLEIVESEQGNVGPVAMNDSPSNMPKECVAVKKKKSCGAVAHVFASLLSVFLSIVMLFTVALSIFRMTISPSTFSDFFKHIEITEIKITEFIPKEELESYGLVVESDNLIDIVFDNIDQTDAEVPFTKEQLVAIVEDDSVTDFFGDIFDEGLDALLDGDLSEIISTEYIVDFIEDNRDVISEITEQEITDETITKIEQTIDEEFGEVFEEIKSVKVESVVGEAPTAVLDVLFSDGLLYTLIGVCVAIGLLIMLILRSFNVGSRYFGAVTAFIGLIYLIASIFIMNLIIALLSDFPFASMLEKLTSVITTKMITLSSVLVVFGIVFPIAMYFICKAISKRRA